MDVRCTGSWAKGLHLHLFSPRQSAARDYILFFVCLSDFESLAIGFRTRDGSPAAFFDNFPWSQ